MRAYSLPPAPRLGSGFIPRRGAAREVLKDHLRHCVVGAAQAGDLSALDALEGALDRCMK